jgi:hypothetical protein
VNPQTEKTAMDELWKQFPMLLSLHEMNLAKLADAEKEIETLKRHWIEDEMDFTKAELEIEDLKSKLALASANISKWVDFIEGCFEHDSQLAFHRNDFGGLLPESKRTLAQIAGEKEGGK